MSLRANEFYKATSLDDAHKTLLEDPKNAIIAGGLWMKKMGMTYNKLIDLSNLKLDEIKEDKISIRIGALATLSDVETNPITKELLGNVLKQIMGPAFRNSATIGGSIFGRYPFSDVITALLTLDVTLKFYPEQEMSLVDWLSYKGKMNAILTEIVIKKDLGRAYFRTMKVTQLGFALINISVVKRNNKHYIAVGSRPSGAALALKAMEAADSGKPFEEVADIAINELAFLDSYNVSKEYRKDLAKVYILRGLKEVNK